MNKEYLKIHNYKCFVDQTIEINNLTVLVGVNGAGKSSAIQSLLLLRSSLHERQSEEIALDGIYGLDLGTSSAVINQNAGDRTIALSIYNKDGDNVQFNYDADLAEDRLSLTIVARSTSGRVSLNQKEFHYLNAERYGPRVSHPLSCMQYLNVGVKGQNVAQVIANDGGRTKVEESRMFYNSENPNLDFQVNAWLSRIMPGVKVTAAMDMNTLSAQMRISNNFTRITPALATNFGFGVSYSLPIIVEALTAESGSMLIVENPEAHLHPSAQSSLGAFLARMAYSGLRVVVETHSDHVINGMQQFVAENRDWHKCVTINHFALDPNNQNPLVTAITFDNMANYSGWPDGFMDQSQKDFMELCKVRGKWN